jgi:hypothetical protein
MRRHNSRNRRQADSTVRQVVRQAVSAVRQFVQQAVSAALLATLTACHGGTVYHHFEHCQPTGWAQDDTLTFCMAPAKADMMLHRELELRSNDSYPFTTVSLVVSQRIIPTGVSQKAIPTGVSQRTIPDNSDSHTETLTCQLTDSNGRQKGEGIRLFTNRFPLSDLTVSRGDSIVITVHHHMRSETLPGITDVGIRLTASR